MSNPMCAYAHFLVFFSLFIVVRYRAVEDDLPSELYFGHMNETHHAYPGFFMLATEAVCV